MAEEQKKDKLDQILDKIGSLEKGQQDNCKLIQKNGVKLEQLGSDIKAVAEGHGVIRREMREMKDELKADIKLVDSKVTFLGEKIEEHLKVPHAV